MSTNLSWYTFTSDDKQNADFKVAAIDGYESLGNSYHFTIDLSSSNVDLDLLSLIGKPASLELAPWNGEKVFFYGIVTTAKSLGQIAGDNLLYRVELEPRLSKLRHNITNSAFAETSSSLTIADVIKKVLDRNGLTTNVDFDVSKLSAPVYKRSFIMQYQESDYDFLSRWLELEGVYYYFEHDSITKKEKIVFVDNTSHLTSDSIELNYRPFESVALDQYKTTLLEFFENRQAGTKSVVTKNYNFRQASNEIKAQVDNQAVAWGNRYWFGDNLTNNDQAQHYSKIREESINLRSTYFEGRAYAAGIKPGVKISVSAHCRNSLNASYRVIKVRHQGTQTGFGIQRSEKTSANIDENFYSVSFEAIPENNQFRLPLVTPRPRISGYLPARVQADVSGDVDLDEYGQYRVKLLFEQDDTVSVRVRMATPYNSPSETGHTGFHFPLLKDSEVALAFMDGDLDQPVIVGVFNNSLSLSPVNYSNPNKNRIVSKLGHEFHLDDESSTRAMRMHSAQGGGMMMIGSFGGNFSDD